MSYMRWGHLQADPQLRQKVEAMLREPKMRSAVSRRLNDASRAIKADCEQMANDELHRRPDNRRSKVSLAHGKHYHDSFEIVPAATIGVDKLRVSVKNTHPMARLIEDGSRRTDYSIQAVNAKVLKLPGGPAAGKGSPGVLGDFAVGYGSDPEFRFGVIHPGVGPHKILYRALRNYRRRARRARGIPGV